MVSTIEAEIYCFLPDVAIWMNGWEKKWTEGKELFIKRESHCKCVSSSAMMVLPS